MYAVIETGGEQIRVSAGDKVQVDRISGEVNAEVIFDKVLVLSSDGKISVGKPYIAGASVKAEILGESKARKVLVLRVAPKKAHNKLRGHRQIYTTLQIKEIIGG